MTRRDLNGLGIGAMLGGGVFVVPGVVASIYSGPAVVLSMLLAGLTCACGALCYGELAAGIGGCGSSYRYSSAAFGSCVGWLVGWNLILDYALALIFAANLWSRCFVDAMGLLGYVLPSMLTRNPTAGGLFNVPAGGILWCLMTLLLVGVCRSIKFNLLLVSFVLIILGVFGTVAIANINTEFWDPFVPFGWAGRSPDDTLQGVLPGAVVAFCSLAIFDAVSAAEEEALHPERDIPFALMSALGVGTFLYALISGLLTAMVRYADLDVAAPIGHALQLSGFRGAHALIAAGTFAGLTSLLLGLLFGLTRLLFAMARDRPHRACPGSTSRATRSPGGAIVIGGLVIGTAAGLLPVDALIEGKKIGTLIAFASVCIAVMRLRAAEPDLHRPFRVPAYPLLPILGALSAVAMLGSVPTASIYPYAMWTALGLALFFAARTGRKQAGPRKMKREKQSRP